MKLEESILDTVKQALGVDIETTSFDTDICMNINTAILELNQNGVGNPISVDDRTKTWNDLKDPSQVGGNRYFQFVPNYITLKTKVMFDPPPPSSVEYHLASIDTLLWRLKVFYEMRVV